MTRRTHSWITIAALIAALLGGAYLIVQNNPTPSADSPSGFMH